MERLEGERKMGGGKWTLKGTGVKTIYIYIYI